MWLVDLATASFPKIAALSPYVDRTSVRALAVTYTNTLPGVLMVLIGATQGGNASVNVLINGVVMGAAGVTSGGLSAVFFLSFAVPTGGTYRLNGTMGVPSFNTWMEAELT